MYLNALKYRREKYSTLNTGSFKVILSFTANRLKSVLATFCVPQNMTKLHFLQVYLNWYN